ncbi:hypothetical protein WA026_014118 [Henosepilachna vigintioctopunctata]|uniref:Tetratricopeptide repeat protein 1 n=1 Tax=Henosepilachna vigintioctopunctata TaxID=420089 RepID=A0AAW1TV24_9CUCU
MSENLLHTSPTKTESEKLELNENLEDELLVRCNMIESKSDHQVNELHCGNASLIHEELDKSHDSDKKLNDLSMEKPTEEEMEMKRSQAVELKKLGNEQYKLQRYLDSIATYNKALLICPTNCDTERSIIYANRAAANIHIGNKESAIQDCSKSLQLNSRYMKAYLRRASLYEELDQLNESLDDYKKVLDIDPNCLQAQTGCKRVETNLYEKNEKLKEEMIGKLKDLGNLVLRPFGLSTDNFNLEKNSETGGYSINFNQKERGS